MKGSTEIHHRCPCCGASLDYATPIDGSGAAPTPGDLTICIECAIISRFTLETPDAPDSRLTARLLEIAELVELDQETRVALGRAQGLVLDMVRRRKARGRT